MDIEAIHRKRGFAMLTGGETIPAAAWTDADGDDCDEPEAVAAVFGPDAAGKWWAVDLREYAPAPTH